MPLKLTTYYRGKDIPDLPGTNTFHSKELFQIYESTPGYTPLLIVATEEGRPVARLLAAIRKTKKWLPSSLVKQCVVYGAGEFLDTSLPASKEKEEEIFGEMLEHLTQEASRTCILIEFRNLDNSMFGYRFFRKNDFFPVNWLRVRNSLHSTQKAEDRFSPSRIRQIRKGLKNGAKVVEAHTVEEIKEFSRMLHKVYSSRIRRYFPANDFFRHMNSMLIRGKQAKIFIVKYKEKIMVNVIDTRNSVLNTFLSEIRAVDIQQDRMRFRRNLERVGEVMAYEISKTFDYSARTIQTPINPITVMLPRQEVVIATVLRAGLPFHQGFLNYFDHAGSAFVSARRAYSRVEGQIEIRFDSVYTPDLTGKQLLLVDPMLATGKSLVITYRELLKQGSLPAHTHIASVIASRQGVEYVEKELAGEPLTLWTAALDEALTDKFYIDPGLGDAGDLAFGDKK